MTDRPLYEIADEIEKDWSARGKGVNYAAEPYLGAMKCLHDIHDNYGADSAADIVLRFLVNAGTWRGNKAREIKAELKAMVKGI